MQFFDAVVNVVFKNSVYLTFFGFLNLENLLNSPI